MIFFRRTNYARGSDFERRVRDHALSLGAVLVVKSGGSRGAADLVIFWPGTEEAWLVQAKRDGVLSPAERDVLISKARQAEVKAFLARPRTGGGKSPARGVEFVRLYPEQEDE